MKKTTWPFVILFTFVFALIQACGGGDDDDNDTSKGGSGETSGGKGGGGKGGSGTAGDSSGAIADGTNIKFSSRCSGNPPFSDQTCLNSDCPDISATPPIKEAGDCCKRVDLTKYNQDKEADKKVYEYRVMITKTISLAATAGTVGSQSAVGVQHDRRAWLTLIRLTGDITKGGKITYEVGPGIYNCDGTYSFYAKGAAPSTDTASYKPTWSKDPDRYSTPVVQAEYFPEDGRMQTAPADRKKGFWAIPVYDYNKADFPLGYEVVSQASAIVHFPLNAGNPDCVGSRSGTAWDPQGIFESFTPMEQSDKVVRVWGYQNDAQSSCQYTAFSLLPQGQEKTTTCSMERCDITANASCAWKELPDSLCPKDSEEEKVFICHLGNKKKADELMKACDAQQYTDLAPKAWCETLKKWSEAPCSKTPPTSLEQTPQCCDPLAKGTDGLPPCNAWRSVSKFTAASIEITDEPTNKLATVCQ